VNTPTPLAYIDHQARHAAGAGNTEHLTSRLQVKRGRPRVRGHGQRPGRRLRAGSAQEAGIDVHVLKLSRARRGQRRERDGGGLRAAARRTRPRVYGVGLDPNIVTATLRAVVSAANRACALGWTTIAVPATVATA
jgi:2-isopropylmalate synthase